MCVVAMANATRNRKTNIWRYFDAEQSTECQGFLSGENCSAATMRKGQCHERLAVVGVAVPNNSTLGANWSEGDEISLN